MGQQVSRRRFLGYGLLAAAGGLVVARGAHDALASDWCWDDPIVSINGYSVQIITGVHGEPGAVSYHVQAANVDILVPSGVSTAVLFTTATYYPEIVRFLPSGSAWSAGQDVTVTLSISFSRRTPGAMPSAAMIGVDGTVMSLSKMAPSGQSIGGRQTILYGATNTVMTYSFTIAADLPKQLPGVIRTVPLSKSSSLSAQ